MKTCYYELLGVARDATEAAIKKAYFKLALQLHPDKNPDRIAEATRQFAELQNAYSVLSDPNERAWYDGHREQILREDGDEDDDGGSGIHLMPFFSSSAFSGFGDNAGGFYTVYRDVFEAVAKEEAMGASTDDDDLDDEDGSSRRSSRGSTPSDLPPAPSFGTSQSPETDVRQFYAYWSNFVSRQSFAQADKYRLSEAPNRQIRRLMEKENKKLREVLRREFVETVRNLAAFVKKRDKRLDLFAQRRKEEEEARQARDQERLAEEKRKRREAALAYKPPAWMETSVAELEAALAAEARNDEEDEEEEILDEFYCAACSKVFKSAKQWENHERSKKHLERVAQLRSELEEDDLLAEAASEEPQPEAVPAPSAPPPAPEPEPEPAGTNDASAEPRSADRTENADDGGSDEDDEAKEEELLAKLAAGIRLQAGGRRSGRGRAAGENNDDDDDDDNWDTGGRQSAAAKKRGKRGKGAATAAAPAAPVGVVPDSAGAGGNNDGDDEDASEWACETCRQQFASRNKLFAHIKQTRHAAPLASASGSSTSARRSKKR